MIKNFIRLLFTIILLSYYIGFSQESYKVTFDIKENIYAPIFKGKTNTNRVSIIRANIKLTNGGFSIIIIDYNKNNSFTDYRGCCKKNGSDGILFCALKENIINIPFFNRLYLLKEYPVAINGNTFILKNLHENKNGIYIADLVRKKIELDSIFKTRNKIIIDTLPNIKLFNLFTNKEFIIKSLKKETRKLYLNVMNQTEFLHYLMYDTNKLSLKKYFTNYDLVNIVVIKNKIEYNYMIKKYKKYSSNFIMIDTSDKQKLIKLGYNLYRRSTFLFDEKGKLILTDAFNFLNKKNRQIH